MNIDSRQGYLARLVAAAVIVLAAGGAARAQVPDPPAANYTEVVAPMQDMRDGRKEHPVMDEDGRKIRPEAKDIMTRYSKFLTYRLAQPIYQDPEKDNPRDEKSMHKLQEEAQRWLIHDTPDRKLNPRQREFATEFAKVMDEQLKFVLANSPKPIVRLNAVRMMSMVAKMPYAGTVDALLGVVNDAKETSGVKFWAFEGLRNLLAQDTGEGYYIIEQPEKLAEVANVVMKFITTPYPSLPQDPYEAAAIPFMRRQAIRTLGAFHDTVIRNRAKDPLARPGLLMVQILLGDPSFTPPLTHQERIEGLIGFCTMRPDKEIRTDVAATSVNEAVLEFVRIHGDERNARGDSAAPTLLPWKVFGARLSVALTAWRKNTEEILPPSANRKPILELVARLQPVARALEDGGVRAALDARDLNDFKANQPPQPPYILFKDDKDSAVVRTIKAPEPKKSDPKNPEPKGPAPKAGEQRKGS